MLSPRTRSFKLQHPSTPIPSTGPTIYWLVWGCTLGVRPGPLSLDSNPAHSSDLSQRQPRNLPWTAVSQPARFSMMMHLFRTRPRLFK
ncbi:hypothetical protein JAAARDRAFT_42144, partial [Jaapia argillacea MUCL 33604]